MLFYLVNFIDQSVHSLLCLTCILDHFLSLSCEFTWIPVSSLIHTLSLVMILIKFMQQVPSAPAAAVSCSSPTAHSVAVSWQPLSRKHANGVIVSYLVVLEQVEEDGEFWSGSGKWFDHVVCQVTLIFMRLHFFRWTSNRTRVKSYQSSHSVSWTFTLYEL